MPIKREPPARNVVPDEDQVDVAEVPRAFQLSNVAVLLALHTFAVALLVLLAFGGAQLALSAFAGVLTALPAFCQGGPFLPVFVGLLCVLLIRVGRFFALRVHEKAQKSHILCESYFSKLESTFTSLPPLMYHLYVSSRFKIVPTFGNFI